MKTLCTRRSAIHCNRNFRIIFLLVAASSLGRSCCRGFGSVQLPRKRSSHTTMASLSDYLKETWDAFHDNTNDNLHICIGNPAGDADSLVSAMVYGYLTQQTPILSIARSDLQSQRPETMALLQLAQIDPNYLLDTNDLNNWIEKNDDESSLQITLLDHNARVFPSVGKVVEILDHHDDQGQHLEAPIRKIAFHNGQATVASTCTLVAEAVLRKTTNEDPQEVLLDPSMSVLLLGTIILDSVNMSPQAGKGTRRDARAMRLLLEQTHWNDQTIPQPDPSQLFDKLQQAKFDPVFWNGLSVMDALRLDYKAFDVSTSSTIGLATILLPWKDFQQKANLVATLESYARDHSLNILGCMMTASLPDGSLQRELLLCSHNATRLNMLVEQLQACQDNFLQLTEQEVLANPLNQEANPLAMRFFVQGNAKASRKQVAPILMEIMGKLPTTDDVGQEL